MSIDLDSRPSSATDYERYRALSTSAVASLIVGLLGCMALLDWTLVAIPLVGVALSAFAWLKVRRHRDELSGAGLARAGFILSVVFLIAGPSYLTYVYLTEVPSGYERVNYSELQPDESQPGQQVPPSALALDGKRVFIKGYIYPGREKDGIRQFLLCRDQGDCCFGGNPKITDRIQVTLVDPLRLSYQPRLHKIGGTFHVAPQQQVVGGAKGGVFYHLSADHLE
jgi:hypothetical protein